MGNRAIRNASSLGTGVRDGGPYEGVQWIIAIPLTAGEVILCRWEKGGRRLRFLRFLRRAVMRKYECVDRQQPRQWNGV